MTRYGHRSPAGRCFRPALVPALLIGAMLGCRTSGIGVTPLESPSTSPALQSADPALAVMPGSGHLVLSWIEGDGATWTLYVARSADGGDSWSHAVRVAGGPDAPGEVHPHGESSPRLVAATGGRLALAWPNSITVPGRKWPAAMMRFARSADGGLSWSTPITLNDDTTGALVSHQFHGAAWVGDSGLAVAWLDERDVAAPVAAGTDGHAEHPSEPDATIYLTTSDDFGRSWRPNRVGWSAACPCCRVTLARDTAGRALAAWRKHFPGNVRDVVVATLGADPGEARRVHADEWSYPGCPHSGPAFATGGDGAGHVVWYNGKAGEAGVYYTRWTGQGGTSPVGLVTGSRVGTAHPAVAPLADGGALAAFDISAGGDRRIEIARLTPDGSIAGKTTVPGSDEGKYPQLAVLDDSTAVVGWTATVGEGSRMRLARLRLP